MLAAELWWAAGAGVPGAEGEGGMRTRRVVGTIAALGLCVSVAMGVGMGAALGGGSEERACLVIAHRGASAYLPEHTLAAYALAYGQGADFIEPDVVMTADGRLVCSHDTTVSNRAVMERVFPGRVREDGEWYYMDFTLEELRSLDESPGRGGERVPGLRIATLGECLTLVGELNAKTGRDVGVIPEPKRPAWHREQGMDLAASLVSALSGAGYVHRGDSAVVQCFELAALRRMREELGCELRLVYLCGDPVPDGVLDEVASFADGIGPSFKLIETEEGGAGEDPTLIERALGRGLGVYAYTFGTDRARQRRFVERGVSGLFTNNPDITRGVVDSGRGGRR